jgi:hypothetical protein
MSKVSRAVYRCSICLYVLQREVLRETICPFCHKPMTYVHIAAKDDD